MKRDWMCGIVVATVAHGAFFCVALPVSGNATFSVVQAPSAVEVSLVAVRQQKLEVRSEKLEVKRDVKIQKIEDGRQKKEDKKGEEKKKNEKQSKPSLANTKTGAITKAQVRTSQNVAPKYPHVARERGYEGVVVLRVIVSVEGVCKKVSVKKSSGYRMLDNAAVKAVKTWQFTPAERAEVTFESEIEIPVEFRLK